MSVRPTSPALRKAAVDSLLKVFTSLSPFDCATASDGMCVRIGYAFMYDLDRAEFAVLCRAAALLGESEAYISVNEAHSPKSIIESPETWVVSLDEYPYSELQNHGWTSIMENAIYSTRGTWAIKVAHTSHIVVGGQPEFVEAFASALPQFSEESLIAMVRDEWYRPHVPFPSGAAAWLPPCLTAALGSDLAAAFLRAADWNLPRREDWGRSPGSV